MIVIGKESRERKSDANRGVRGSKGLVTVEDLPRPADDTDSVFGSEVQR